MTFLPSKTRSKELQGLPFKSHCKRPIFTSKYVEKKPKAFIVVHFVCLQNDNLKIKDLDEIPSTLPDICIAYKLHQECGRYINLVDWFQVWLILLCSSSKTPNFGLSKRIFF